MISAARLNRGFWLSLLAFALACATLLADPAAAAPRPPAMAIPEQLWTHYPLDPTEATTSGRRLTVGTGSTAPSRRSPSSPVAEAEPAARDEPLIGFSSPSVQLGLLAALGSVVVFTALSSFSLLVPAHAPEQPGRAARARRTRRPAASRIRRKAGPEPAALRPAAVPHESAPEEIEQTPRRAGRPATWLTEPYESCEIAIWRGYWKGRFYARPTFPEPEDFAIEASAYFRIRSDLPKQRGAALRAYEHLVEKLIRQGWEPSGLGGEWYEQWFRRPLVPMPGPRPHETPSGTKTPA